MFCSSTFSEFSDFSHWCKNFDRAIFLFSGKKQCTFLPNLEANVFLYLRFSMSYGMCRFAVFDAVLFAVAVAVAVTDRGCLCGCGCGCG